MAMRYGWNFAMAQTMAFYSARSVRLRVESGRSPWPRSGFWPLIGLCGCGRSHLALSGSGWLRQG